LPISIGYLEKYDGGTPGPAVRKEGAVGAVGEKSPLKSSHREEGETKHTYQQAQPSEKKKLRYACWPFRMNNLK
jgi:hypothetical protein